MEISDELISYIKPELALNYRIIPKQVDNDHICFYTSVTDNQEMKEELEIILGKKVTFHWIPENNFHPDLIRLYQLGVGKIDKKRPTDIESFRKDFLQELIEEAFLLGSSDIHIEPLKEYCRIRFRLDGKLIEHHLLNRQQYPSLLNKIKVKSNLDIAEKRLPQDGRLSVIIDNQPVDIRVSTLPSVFGEKVVLRLLSNNLTLDISVDQLGLSQRQKEDILEAIHNNYGLILISGPTGSGKTTTLYAILKILNSDDVNVLTIEDPVEYMIDGVNQVQLKENIGFNFATALRTFLRQDPDIIMLGEVRDPETAQMAIRASLTGHLVLSTIHTNSAWGTITRLIDMGIPPFLISDTLLITASQRLLRKLCPHCKVSLSNCNETYQDILVKKGLKLPIFQAVGCDKCHFTGYKGRIGVYEVVPITKALKEYIKKNELDITEYLRRERLSSLTESALHIVNQGITSLEEILPIIITEK